MNASNLVSLALSQAGCSQKELAARMKVSAAQISKWKAGESISVEMEQKLKSISGIGDRDPDIVYWVGGVEQADKWMRLFEHLAEYADATAESSYDHGLVEDEIDLLFSNVFHTLVEAGVEIPKEFPAELDFDYDDDSDEREDSFEILCEKNPYSSLISHGLKAFIRLYDFFVAYIRDIVWDDALCLEDTEASNIESGLFGLALAKIGGDWPIISKYRLFKYETFKDYRTWLDIVKNTAVRNKVPLKAELMHLLSEDPESLVHEAEAEALGFNSCRIHPDIYMNEILQSLRLMHQVLPAICKKLGITEDELKIDDSALGI